MRTAVLCGVGIAVALASSGCRRVHHRGPAYDFQRVAAYGAGACGVMKDGTLRCWGDAAGTTGRAGAELARHGPGVTAACVGRGYVCFVAGGEVRCARGGGAALPVDGVSGATDVSCERTRACALDGAGRVSCWAAPSGLARRVEGLERVVGLASGPCVTCAVIADGTVRCTGDNGDGQLGDGTTEPRSGLVTAKIDKVARVSIGTRHACATRTDDAVWCWGRNDHGQLGDGGRADRALPGPVLGLVGAGDVAAGGAHACARMKDSTVRCWGDGSHHQAGRSTSREDVLAPELVPGLYEATAAAAGEAFSCARMKDGWLRCWGANDAGQLADGTATERAVPVPIRYP